MSFAPPDRSDAVDALVRWVETRIPCVDGLYAHHCQTGDPYVQFSLRGDDVETVCRHMRDMIGIYLEHREGEAGATLFWRYAPPRIVWYAQDRDEAPRGRLQTRLVVSAKPIVWATVEEYDAARTLELERTLLGSTSH